MKTAKNDLTLKNIADLFDRKFDEKFDKAFDRNFDQKLAPVNSRLESLDLKVGSIFNELGALKQQISDVNNNLGAKIGFVDSKLEEFRQETKANFVGVYDGMSSLADTLDQDLEPRIKSLERRQLFA